MFSLSLSGMGLLQTLELASTLDTVTECIRLLFFCVCVWYFYPEVSREAPEAASKNHYFTRGNSCHSPKVFPVPWGAGSARREREADAGQAIISVTGWLLCRSLGSACDVTASWSVVHRVSSHSHSSLCSQSKNIISVCNFNADTFYLHVLVHATQQPQPLKRPCRKIQRMKINGLRYSGTWLALVITALYVAFHFYSFQFSQEAGKERKLVPEKKKRERENSLEF